MGAQDVEPQNFYDVVPLAYTGAATAFTYQGPANLAAGAVVTVPITRRRVVGVIKNTVPKPKFATKPLEVVEDIPAVPAELRELAGWISEYYAASPSSVWSTMLPAGLSKKRRATKDPAAPAKRSGSEAPPLTTEQSQALAQIHASEHSAHLLQGVTGSGKTRVYLELAAEALHAGRSVIILVPEITLTPQTVAAFEAAFGPLVLTSHSKLTEAGRHGIWLVAAQAAAAGQPRIIIGPRSCLFMPTSRLGLIVIDECHETSYKQDQHPRYHAVTAAARLAQITSSRLVLGSATPGLIELYLAQQHRLEHVLLTQRVNQLSRPQAKIIDLRDKSLFKLSKFITQPLVEAISNTIDLGRQSLLYLNRRGSASSQVCSDCGHVTSCPNCALPLTFHADLMRLVCHHCNFRMASPAVCPECHNADLRLIGIGTKRLETEIVQLFPGARIARLDRDSATVKHINTVLKGLREREIDIVVGTQMIAKGLDLAGLDTVGVINADTLLHLPDFSAAERTFQLLSQVSGRAGRGDRPGEVFIQTYTPEHPAIRTAAAGNYQAFATAELAARHALRYPPYVFLLKITVAAPTRDAAQSEAAAYAAKLRAVPGLEIAGPAPAFIETQGAKYHWVITVKCSRRPPLVQIAQNLPHTRWTADLDPINLL